MKELFKLIILSILVIGCNYHRFDVENIKIINKSASEIYCIISTNDSIKTLDYYSGFPKKVNNYKYTFESIQKDSTSSPNDRPKIWTELIKKSKDEKIRVFVIKKNLVDTNGWEIIMSKNIYNKKYELSIEDLKNMNWQIEYFDLK